MGTNIIHLADFAVPSYRRARAPALRLVNPGAAAPQGDGHTDGLWSTMARRRAAQKLRAVPRGEALAAVGPVSAGACVQARPQGGPVRVSPSPDAGGVTGSPSARAAGRLRISGRLIDVCAELERLAAAETAALAMHPRRA